MSFEPTFHPDRLRELATLDRPTPEDNLKRKPWIAQAFPHNWLIFVCSVADLFATWTKQEWADAVLGAARDCPVGPIFQFLTKNPERINTVSGNKRFPRNQWVGATITSRNDQHLDAYMRGVEAEVKFLSFEPLLGEVHPDLRDIDWMIIGKLTGSHAVKLDPEWVRILIRKGRDAGVPIFVKDNVGWSETIREFPKL